LVTDAAAVSGGDPELAVRAECGGAAVMGGPLPVQDPDHEAAARAASARRVSPVRLELVHADRASVQRAAVRGRRVEEVEAPALPEVRRERDRQEALLALFGDQVGDVEHRLGPRDAVAEHSNDAASLRDVEVAGPARRSGDVTGPVERADQLGLDAAGGRARVRGRRDEPKRERRTCRNPPPYQLVPYSGSNLYSVPCRERT
jgi:hypothetical protein